MDKRNKQLICLITLLTYEYGTTILLMINLLPGMELAVNFNMFCRWLVSVGMLMAISLGAVYHFILGGINNQKAGYALRIGAVLVIVMSIIDFVI